jgi:hypothetical protein
VKAYMEFDREQLERIYESVSGWCSAQDFSGYDPYDGLNSLLFQSTPLKRYGFARLAWTQLLKRSPVNFRPLAKVYRGKNSKGVALFTLAYLARYRQKPSDEVRERITRLLDYLLETSLKVGNGVAWGYNFDWQGRAFFAPIGTPTIVPTAFVARALMEAAQVLKEPGYLVPIERIRLFIEESLVRTIDTREFLCFSYSPYDNTKVFNASLLATEVLAEASDDKNRYDLVSRAVRYVISHQREDGSWAYGADNYQGWSDNFHTAFILLSLSRILRACPQLGEDLQKTLVKGYEFWRSSFFLNDGAPKYFHNSPYPFDCHSSAAAIIALMELKELDSGALEMAKTIMRWTIQNLYDPEGYFYYQKRRLIRVRIPYMRWTQAWMLYATTKLLEEL